MAIPRAVNATLVERFIFNFRLKPEGLAKRLPVPWLEPQIINGWSVVSFCILSLERIIIAPLPGMFGYKSLSCSYRCGVIDKSDASDTPSVYILDRYSDLPLIARIAPLLFLDTIPMARIQLERAAGVAEIRIWQLDQQNMFGATVRPTSAPGTFESDVFMSLEDFKDFIKAGVSSYTPSVFGDALARVDLQKEDTIYEAMDASVDLDCVETLWAGEDLIFDSAVRAFGGRYTWTYRGIKSAITEGPAGAVATMPKRLRPLTSRMRLPSLMRSGPR